MDRNNLTLVGKVGNKIKRAKNVNGGEYAWFPLYIENTSGATSVEANFHQGINVMVFKPNVLKYLDKVKLKQGNNVVIFGFISSFKQEVKGQTIVCNGVNANEVYVIKTRSDEDIINSNK